MNNYVRRFEDLLWNKVNTPLRQSLWVNVSCDLWESIKVIDTDLLSKLGSIVEKGLRVKNERH